jgi:hypothetical protein
LFDSPAVITAIAQENNVDLAETMLFFYEVHELQFDSSEWTRFEPESSFGTNVRIPETKVFEGYDVVTFAVQNAPERNYVSPPLPLNWSASSANSTLKLVRDP